MQKLCFHLSSTLWYSIIWIAAYNLLSVISNLKKKKKPEAKSFPKIVANLFGGET